MSRVYVTDVGTDDLIEIAVEARNLNHVHKPLVEDPVTGDMIDSLWPDGVCDGTGNHGWFENGMVLFWGFNSESGILEELRRQGVKIVDTF